MDKETEYENEETTKNYENDAREEDVVEDTDADTRDIDETVDVKTEAIMDTMKSMLSMIEDLAAKVDKVSSAQDVISTNARIVDNDITPVSTQLSNAEIDDTPSLSDFDFTLD